MMRLLIERLRRSARAERGAVLLLSGVAVTALLATAAVVVDLAAVRNDRSANKTGADAAAAAGVLALAEGSGPSACQAAVEYVEVHLDEVISGTNCAAMPIFCTGVTPAVSTSGTAGDITVTITHPVPDGDPLMTSEAIGSPSQPIVARDGHSCARLAVQIVERRTTLFGRTAGITNQTTSIHSVALLRDGGDVTKAINLLILHRTDCESITIGGGGSTGGIIVSGVTNPVTGALEAGLLAADSDGTTNCGSGGVLDVDGSGAVVRADGAPGCPDELPSGPGHGCGSVEIFAQSPPGCAMPACSSSGVVAPGPTHPRTRLTRSQIDWRFNCKASYPVSYDIGRCPEAGVIFPYIDELAADIGPVGRPAGFDRYRGAGFKCTIRPGEAIVVPVGNWWVDCDLTVRGSLTFSGGNIVFDGDVTLNAGGALHVNTANPMSSTWIAGFDHTDHAAESAYVYMRDGGFNKAAQASVTLQNTMVYLSSTSTFDMTGGSGSMIFVAPTKGPFEDLAMWSESALEHGFSGGSTLDLEGVFFTPIGTVRYTGSGAQDQVQAQFITSKLVVGGNGALKISPIHDRMVLFTRPESSELIR